MPRINVEESFWIDPRLDLLATALGSRRVAIGTILDWWRFAQENWRTQKPIQKDFFDKYYGKELVEAGFAEYVDDTVRCKGSSDHFQWLDAKREAGRKGGKQKLANASTRKQTLPSSSSSSSSSSSDSSSKEINTHVQVVFDAYCKSWDKNPKQYKLDANRRRWITDAIDRYGVDGALKAIERFRNDKYEQRAEFNGLEYLFSPKKIDRWCSAPVNSAMERARQEHVESRETLAAALEISEGIRRASAN